MYLFRQPGDGRGRLFWGRCGNSICGFASSRLWYMKSATMPISPVSSILIRSVTAKEQHAETQEYEWTEQIVIPYLRAEYNDTVKLLEDWASTWSGHPITLNELIDEPRALPTDASFLSVWRFAPAWLIVPHLAHAVATGKSPEQIQEWFAGYVHLRQMDR
jgi:hypothetical protein